MVLQHCPNCQAIMVFDQFNTDIIHQCSVTSGITPSLAFQEKFLIGDWTDYTGSQVGLSTASLIGTPKPNALFGTRGEREGNHVPSGFTQRGANRDITRTRPYLHYINDLKPISKDIKKPGQ